MIQALVSANVSHFTPRLTVEERIKALPQELQDQILESTLIASLKLQEVVTLNKSYFPPWQLSINRVTRKTIAEAYYGVAIFQVVIDASANVYWQDGLGIASKWLASLSERERSSISQLRFNRSFPAQPANNERGLSN